MDDGVPAPQVWPTLRANDARGLIRFLVEAFGFEEVLVIGVGDHVDQAELRWPLGGGVILGSVHDRDAPTPGGFSAYVVTDDPDGLDARAVAAGAEIIMELHDTDYGSAAFAARDAEGNRWSFGTCRGAPVPALRPDRAARKS